MEELPMGKESSFSPQTVYQRTIDGQGRTNNYTEAWNKAFQVLTGRPNESLRRVITSLKMDSTSTRKTISDMEMGHPDTVTRCRQNKRYDALALRVEAIVKDYPNRVPRESKLWHTTSLCDQLSLFLSD